MSRLLNINTEVNKHYDTGWKNLKKKYITKEGLALIDSDPDISDETLAALKETEKQFLNSDRNYTFYFDADRDGSNIGETVLSILINENPNVCFAHLVSLYAELKNYPFIIVLLALDPYRKSKNGFKRFSYSPVFGLSVERWFPAKKNKASESSQTSNLPKKRKYSSPESKILS